MVGGNFKGFTLVELIVTIAVATILMSIIVPSFAGLIESSKERATRDLLVSSIYTAKQQAQSQRVNVNLCPTADGLNCLASTSWGDHWLVYEDRDGSNAINSGDTIITNISSKTLLIKSSSNQVTFSPTGHSTNNVFQVCRNTDNTVVYQIELSRMGRVSFTAAGGSC